MGVWKRPFRATQSEKRGCSCWVDEEYSMIRRESEARERCRWGPRTVRATQGERRR